ncbi:MAG: hypothetical protein QOC96_160 [Acidobacteriota bacterium]|jgi:hypothetical protein|nr:hypothetical protein [Acidobacteriota bacterium]
MFLASSFILAQQQAEFGIPSYFNLIVLSLLALGVVGWLIATVLGFARARAFGPATRWFALAALCLLIYHVQLVVMVLAAAAFTNRDMVLSIGAFFNLFIVIGAVCAIMGFIRLTNPR